MQGSTRKRLRLRYPGNSRKPSKKPKEHLKEVQGNPIGKPGFQKPSGNSKKGAQKCCEDQCPHRNWTLNMVWSLEAAKNLCFWFWVHHENRHCPQTQWRSQEFRLATSLSWQSYEVHWGYLEEHCWKVCVCQKYLIRLSFTGASGLRLGRQVLAYFSPSLVFLYTSRMFLHDCRLQSNGCGEALRFQGRRPFGFAFMRSHVCAFLKVFLTQLETELHVQSEKRQGLLLPLQVLNCKQIFIYHARNSMSQPDKGSFCSSHKFQRFS